MSQENVVPQRPLQKAVERQAEALNQVGEAIGQPGGAPLREAVEEHAKTVDEVQRELERQETGTLPKGAVPEPESTKGQPGLA
ncbi:MAG TPA: hypothetical protein VGD78_19155 [Chthoniobacterales bacterium]